MASSIICCMSFSLCGLAFILIGYTQKNSDNPITFFSGDDSLKVKITNMKRYNKQMSKLYVTYGSCFIFIGIISFLNIILSLILLAILLTIGLGGVYFSYNRILKENS